MAQKVNAKLAAKCVERYQKLYQSNDIAAINKAYTTSILFPVESIKAVIQAMADTDNVEIKLGVYTKEFAAEYPTAHEGRLTAFIYPKPATITKMNAVMDAGVDDPGDDTYNLGVLEP